MYEPTKQQGAFPFAERIRGAVRPVLGAAVVSALTVFAAVPARAQTAAPPPPRAASGSIAPRDIMESGGIGVSSRRLRPGQTVYITLNLRKLGSGTARSQGPSPRTVYSQDDTFTQKGMTVVDPNRFSVVMTLSGPRGREWPYRWGIGGDLKLDEYRTVTFPLRMTRPGMYTLYIGIAAGNEVRELALGQIGLEVAPRGQAFQTRGGRSVGTPPPTRITINGKAVAMDQWPRFYEAPFGKMTANPEILVPIRFVTEEMGAQVDWKPATRTAHIRRAGNHLVLRAGSTNHQANGKPITSHTRLRVVDGRTMVPLNLLIEQLGGTAQWDLRTRTLAIRLPNLAPTPRAQR